MMAINEGRFEVGVTISSSIARTKTGFRATSSGQGYGSSVALTSIGNGASAFDELYQAVRALAANTSETLDLNGSLVNDLGDTINFARIKTITLELLTDTNSTSITAGNAATNPFVGPLGGTTPTETITNGGFWSNGRKDATGWTVTNNSSDNFKIVNNDASNIATYRITLSGAKT